jgi:hypothetical protein
VVGPTTGRHGRGIRQTQCPWRCTLAEKLQVDFANFSAGAKSPPNVFFKAPGRICMNNNPRALIDLARTLITSLGGVIISERLSRIDIAIDLPDLPITQFLDAYHEGRYICHGDPILITGKDGTTLWFKSKNVQMRLYEKIALLRCRKNIADLNAMVNRRWGGVEPQDATRLEFQLMRCFLKNHGVSSPDSYFAKRQALALHLMKKRFRFTANTFDRLSNHHSRAGILPVWQQIADALQQSGNAPDSDLSPLPKQAVSVVDLAKTLLGLAVRITGDRGLNNRDRSVVEKVTLEEIRKHWGMLRRRGTPGDTP